jgi:hypothetical protein
MEGGRAQEPEQIRPRVLRKRHLEEGSGPKAVRAVRQQLKRLLNIEERQAKEKAEWEREFQEAVHYLPDRLLALPLEERAALITGVGRDDGNGSDDDTGS